MKYNNVTPDRFQLQKYPFVFIKLERKMSHTNGFYSVNNKNSFQIRENKQMIIK